MHYIILVVALLLAADGVRSIVDGVRTLSNKSPDIEHDSEIREKAPFALHAILDQQVVYGIHLCKGRGGLPFVRNTPVVCKVVRNNSRPRPPPAMLSRSGI